MRRWPFVALIILLIGIFLVAQISNAEVSRLIMLAGAIVRFVAIYLMSKRGSFYYTRLYRLVYLCLAIIVMGMLARIQHWTLFRPLLLTGYGGILMLYLLHFVRKKRKGGIDYLKLSYAILLLSGVIGNIFDADISYWLSIPVDMLLILLLFYHFRYSKDRQLQASVV